MINHPLPASILLLALALAAGSAQAQTAAPKTPGPKAPAPKAAARPAAAPTAFDATNPQGLMDVLSAAGAKVQTSRKEDDAVFIAVTSTAATFSMQFAGCNAQGRACRAVLLDAALPKGAATAAQVNGFNQTSVMCRLYQDRAGVPHVLYSTLLSRTMSRDDASNELLAWQGCLSDAYDFSRDPVAYLANAA
ncbi:YbjN domain-containing protein [Phenylobacterium sp.]|uniref:YbjN domain-containing protein n=1 Tax=Phenylobacterium sp. TaxID=1871053 RepID=UPI00301B8ECF